MRSGWQPQLEAAADPNAPRPPDRLGLTNRERPGENRGVQLCMWACGAAGSALPWHGRGHRFDPDQVHQSHQAFSATSLRRLCRIFVANSKTTPRARFAGTAET
jgi:hypothetical protein